MKNILVVYTGGTIGGIKMYDTVSEDLKLKNFISVIESKISIPNDVNLKYIAPMIKFSEEMYYKDWEMLANEIKSRIDKSVIDKNEKLDGIVIAHGTDTMAYSCAALSFSLRNHLEIPIIFTGANQTFDVNGSDAVTNLEDAIVASIESQLKGVFLSFSGIKDSNSYIHVGTKVKKFSFAANSNNFKSYNDDYVGYIEKKVYSTKKLFKLTNTTLLNNYRDTKVQQEGIPGHIGFEPNVLLVKLYPNIKSIFIETLLKSCSVKGLVLECYNAGTGPCENIDKKYSIIPALQYAKKTNVPVLVTSQHEGIVTPDKYDTTDIICQNGGIFMGKVSTECAIVKLCWLLKHTSDIEEIKKLLNMNIAGEHS